VPRLLSLILLFAFASCISRAPESPSHLAKLVFNDLEGNPHYPLAPAPKIGSVLIFFWQDCPVCNSYAPEINRICAAHTNFQFYIVQIDPDLTREAAIKHAAEYHLSPPVLLDPEHRLVAVVGATVTPEAAVFGRDNRMVYRGRMDDLYAGPGKRRPQPTRHELSDALDAISAGSKVSASKVEPVGCVIPSVPKH
jgi:hypothetical protein